MSLVFENITIYEGLSCQYMIRHSKNTPINQYPVIIFKIISEHASTDITMVHIGSATWEELRIAAVTPGRVHKYSSSGTTIGAYEKEIMIANTSIQIKVPSSICHKWLSTSRDVIGEWELRGGNV